MSHFRNNLIQHHGVKRFKLRITEIAGKVAATKAHKHRRLAYEWPLALQGREYLDHL
jgi:hypothetical protein